MLSLDDTIAAIASAPGGAVRGLVRVSGPNAAEVVQRCFFPADQQAKLSGLRSARVVSGQIDLPIENLPADLFLWPSNRSYTRQPLAEIHTFGSPPLLEMVLQTVCATGARLARPGEFTLRAFLAGRVDLTQAEAVLGVIDAADRRHLQVALSQLAGGLSRPLQSLRDELLDLLADLEAGLDFVEDDIRFVSPAELENRLAFLAGQLERIAGQLSTRTIGDRRPKVVLVGWPNVGKSSLFNALLGRSAALVSPQEGTTRDYLVRSLDAAHLTVDLVDTAGIAAPSPTQSIDSSAQEMSAGQAAQADLKLLCLDSTRPLNAWEQSQLNGDRLLIVLTKCDEPRQLIIESPTIATSSRTGMGLEQLRVGIHTALTASPIRPIVIPATAARVQDSVRLATAGISGARRLATEKSGDELVAAEIRAALAELGKIVGAVYTDDLLDRVFSRFCIGK